jgi:hypothetical protein
MTSATGWKAGCSATSIKMSLLLDIMDSWRAPRRVVRQHLQRPRSEAFLFTFLFTFLLVSFIAQWPVAARMSHLQPEVPIEQRMFGFALGLFALVMPLAYALAALSRLVAGALGGQGSWYSARLALFWSLASITPAMLLMGLALAFLGQGQQTTALGVVVGAVFVIRWVLMLRETERGL